MQTFLPYGSDFIANAKCLDYRRLGKQRVEALQLLRGSWPHHPASKMWRGSLSSLATYGALCCLEWNERGYKDNLFVEFVHLADPNAFPEWIDDPRLIESHRWNLFRKDPIWYREFENARKITCCPGCNYWWPSHAKRNT